jgi:hypothetical protein
MNKKPKNTHFNQKLRRKAEFIKPPDILKTKVGSGGVPTKNSIRTVTIELMESG